MSSKAVTIITPDSVAGYDVQVEADAATNALLVKVVNPNGGGGGGTQYLEDSAHVSGDTGTLGLVVRKDTPGSLVSADGDYAPLQVDASGALRVVVTSGGGGGTQYAEDAAHVSGDTGTLALVVRNDTPGSLAGADGDYAALQVDASGRLRVAIDAAVAVPVTDNGGSLTVDGAVSVSNFPAVYPVNDNGGSLTVDGTVAISNFPAVQPVSDNGGSLTIDGTVAATQSGAWTVGVNNFPAVYPVNDNGGSLTIDGTIAATQSGAWAVSVSNFPAVQPVSDNSGSLTIDGEVRLVDASGPTNATIKPDGDPKGVSPAALLVGGFVQTASLAGLAAVNDDVHCLRLDSGGNLQVAGWIRDRNTNTNVLAVQVETNNVESDDAGIPPVFQVTGVVAELTEDTWAYGRMSVDGRILVDAAVSSGSLAISTVVPGTSSTNLGKAEDAVHGSGDVGVMALAVRTDTAVSRAGADGDYVPLITDSTGRLHVVLSTPGTAKADLCKAEDVAHASGDVGVMALAVRQDTLAATAANGDYVPLSTDSVGALWVRNKNAMTITTINLSGSTNGKPVQITSTTSGAANTIHTATSTAGEIDLVWLSLSNTSTAPVTVTIEYGAAGAGSEIDVIVPANDVVPVLEGVSIGGAASLVIKAYATTGSVVNALGRVERHVP